MRAAPVVLAAVLSACSGEPPGPQPSLEATGTVEAVAGANENSPAPGAETGLTGKVSALNSAVSGLAVRVTDYGTVIDLPADALFAFDSADLTSGATSQLTKSAQLIATAPAGPIRVVGHTDSKGEDGYNQRLSEARAKTVADWFRRQPGVRQRMFAVEGQGEKQPIAPNETASGQDDPAGRARNRRVEVVLPKG